MINDKDWEEGLGKSIFYKDALPIDFKLFPWKTFQQRFLGEPFPPNPYHGGEISVFLFICFLLFGVLMGKGLSCLVFGGVIVVGVFSLLLGLVLLLCFGFL